MGVIDEQTARSMIADRDAALGRKNRKISELEDRLVSLAAELDEAKRHPLTEDDKATKLALEDYKAARASCVAKLRPSPKDTPLHAMVEHFILEADRTRRERDRYASAWATMHNAAKKSEKIANGEKS